MTSHGINREGISRRVPKRRLCGEKTTLKSDLGADNLPDFLDLVNDTNSKLYNFIDIR